MTSSWKAIVFEGRRWPYGAVAPAPERFVVASRLGVGFPQQSHNAATIAVLKVGWLEKFKMGWLKNFQPAHVKFPASRLP
jgi:hypothetical protein